MPSAPTPPILRHTELLRRQLDLAGARVLDVGCGEGGLVAWFARQGALAVGLDSQSAVLQQGRARPDEAARVAGRGERLPFATAGFQAVVYMNSLHHLPAADLDAALAEAGRVLEPGGSLIAIEPQAAGDHFELLRPLEDETAVRAAAAAALARAAASSFWRAGPPVVYGQWVRLADARMALERFLAVDPARHAALQAARPELIRLFDALGEPDPEGGRRFFQPFTAWELRRVAQTALTIELAVDGGDRQACFAIRRAVFVEEQAVALPLEFDAADPGLPMLLARLDGQPAGTLRWRPAGPGTVKIERVAVLRAFRRRGIGAALLHAVLARLDGDGVGASLLHAQLHARSFYERAGFVIEGMPFDEDGLEHIRMRRDRPL